MPKRPGRPWRQLFEVAQAIENSEGASSRARALTDIATAQTKAGHAEAARQTLATAFEVAQAIENVDERLCHFFEIALTQEKAGSAQGVRVTIDTAIKHFKSAKKDEDLVRAFFSRCGFSMSNLSISYGIGGAPLEADQLAEVIAIAKSPEVENVNKAVLRRLAESLAEEGTLSNFLEVLKLLDPGRRKWELSFIRGQFISRQVEAAQFTEAIETTRLITDPGERSQSLAKIALAQAKGGKVADARATIGLATEAVKSSGDAPAHVLIDMAEAQLEVGLVRDAKGNLRDALEDIKSRGYHTPGSPLSNILEVLLKMHDASLL